MGMTSNIKDIELLTGLKVGKVFLGKEEFESQREGERILDCVTKNFHLFPVIDSKDKIKIWKDYLDLEGEVFEELRKQLQDKLDDSFLIVNGGKKGNLVGIPDFYTENNLNSFFRYCQVKRGEYYYTILFKRFFIAKDNSVNCKFGEVQFFASIDGQINESKKSEKQEIITYVYKNNKIESKKSKIGQILVHYPSSYQGQDIKKIRFSNTPNRVNVYNPKGITNISGKLEIKPYVANIVDSFISYMCP